VRSPTHTPYALNKIEVPVPAQDGQGVLATEGRYPKVIGGYRRAREFELQPKLCVLGGGRFADLQHFADAKSIRQPAFILASPARKRDSESILA